MQAVQKTLQISSVSFSGPIPPPEQLEHYERVHPGLAERIVVMAEKQIAMAESQMAHRHELETKVIDSDIRLAIWGQRFAFVLGVSGLALGGYLVFHGHQLGGSAAFITALGVLLAAFVYSKERKSKDLDNKAGDLVKAK